MAEVAIFPGCELHFVGDVPQGVRLLARGTLDESAPSLPLTLSEFDTTLVRVVGSDTLETVGGRVMGVTIGRARARYGPPGDAYEFVNGLVRVCRHEAVRDFVSGHERLKLPLNSGKRFLSIYAEFDDDTIGAVTRHSWLFSFRSQNPDVVSVDQEGGVQSHGVEGATAIEITHGSRTIRVPVTVERRTPPLVVNLLGRSDERRPWNMLILAEGFRASDEQVFRDVAAQFLRRIFESPSCSPFPLLRDSFNVWSVFEPSLEAGVTIGPKVVVPQSVRWAPNFARIMRGQFVPAFAVGRAGYDPRSGPPVPYSMRELVGFVGLPDVVYGSVRALDRNNIRAVWASQNLRSGQGVFDPSRASDDLINTWFIQSEARYTKTVETRYGMMLGVRRGGDPRSPAPIEGLSNESAWAIGEEHTHLDTDPHRYNEHQQLTAFVSSLRFGSDASHVNYNIGSLMGNGGRVVMFVNDGPRAGTNAAVSAFCVGVQREGIFKTSIPDTESGRIVVRHEPEAYDDSGLIALVATATHEFGHSFALADEYENSRIASEAMRVRATIEERHNVTHISRVAVPASGVRSVQQMQSGRIDTRNIKWNLPRIVKATVLRAGCRVTRRAGSSSFEVQVDPASARQWQGQLRSSPRLQVYLRHRDLHFGSDGSRVAITGQVLRNNRLVNVGPMPAAGPFVISADSGFEVGRLTLTGVVSRNIDIPEDSVLYRPMVRRVVRGGRPVNEEDTIIHHVVLQYISEHGAFPRSGVGLGATDPCALMTHGRTTPPEIPGYTPPQHAEETIGLYVGGGHFTCGVCRAVGVCKMRSEVENSYTGLVDVEFCYVCKYTIVFAIDPTKLPELDAQEYPAPLARNDAAAGDLWIAGENSSDDDSEVG